MPLTKVEMLALLADNTTGDISAEDMRNIVIGMVSIEDEGADLERMTAIQNASFEPTGFNLRDHTTHGVIELCGQASSGIYWRIDENNVFSEITGATTFGDGATTLADRTFVHYPAAGETEFSFWAQGYKITKTTTQTIQLAQVSTKQIVVYKLNAGKTDADIGFAVGVYEAISEDTICAVVTGNPTLVKKVVFANERHGMEMSSATHRMMHETAGARYGDGLDIVGLADNGTTFTSIAAGTIWDEDLDHSVPITTTAPFLWRDSTGYWTVSDNVDNLLGYKNGGANVLYNRDNGNGTWDLVTIGLDYMIMHFFATNDSEYPVFKVVGQTLYADRTTARNHLYGAVTLLKEGDLPTPEFLHLYSMIIHVETAGQIEVGTDSEIYVDFRAGYPAGRY